MIHLARALLLSLLTATLAQAQSTNLEWFHLPSRGVEPSPRTDASIVFEGRGFLLFGGLAGTPQNDLWGYSLDRAEWTELNPSGPRPPARHGHTAVNNIVARVMIVFGGRGADSELLNDVWGYDYRRNRWTQYSAEGPAPAPRYGHTAIFDVLGLHMVMSHGFTGSGAIDDTWMFTGTGWRNVSPASARPFPRGFAGAGVDDAGRQMLLFGGCVSAPGPCPLDDLWAFDLETPAWTRATGPGPPARQQFGMASDTSILGRRLILFGGAGPSGLLADSWQYNFASNSWTQLNPAGTPPSPRAGHSATFNESYDAAIFFGGSTADGLSNEVWMLAPPAGPVVSAASFRTDAFVPGSIVSLFGTDLATSASSAVGLPLPRMLAGTSVEVNDSEVPLFFVSPGQINFQVPWELARISGGALQATVSLGNPPFQTSVATVPVRSVSPGIFTLGHQGEGQGAVLIAGTASLAAPVGTRPGSQPVGRGQYVSIYATGLGAVDNVPQSGMAPSANPPSRTLAIPSVAIGGVAVTVTFSGLAPELVGVYQVNALVPEDAPTGDAVPLVLSIEGIASNTVTVAVR
ncbi:MAG TPA: kelch repeat-containing protein [Terriglobia bacterium]